MMMSLDIIMLKELAIISVGKAFAADADFQTYVLFDSATLPFSTMTKTTTSPKITKNSGYPI